MSVFDSHRSSFTSLRASCTSETLKKGRQQQGRSINHADWASDRASSRTFLSKSGVLPELQGQDCLLYPFRKHCHVVKRARTRLECPRRATIRSRSQDKVR